MLPPCIAMREQRTGDVWVHVTHGDPVTVWIDLETGGGATACGNWRTGPRPGDRRPLGGEASFEIPADLPLGYHTRCGPAAARPNRRCR